MPNNFDAITASENLYFDAYEQDPIWTDLRYFGRIFYNIVVKGARSA